ncbi:MAG: hypothetical protein II877_10845 [Synergistaceae bacterium]|nr:hypothetical protein [Synergistaceae bacterium]
MPDNGKISSPEQLNSYIRVTSPGAWIVLASVLVFLAGLFVWIFFGELKISDTAEKSRANIYAENHTVRPITFLLK